MTWGSNPSEEKLVCRFCGQEYIDDWNPPTHLMICTSRGWWERFKSWWGNHP